jgi:hypothetical protein
MATAEHSLTSDRDDEDVDVRLLREDEFDLLDPVFQLYGVPTANPKLSVVAVALIDGRVIAAMCLRLVPHIDGFHIDEAHRHQGLAWRLAELLRPFVLQSPLPVFIKADTPAAAHMAVVEGFVPSEEPVFIRWPEEVRDADV